MRDTTAGRRPRSTEVMTRASLRLHYASGDVRYLTRYRASKPRTCTFFKCSLGTIRPGDEYVVVSGGPRQRGWHAACLPPELRDLGALITGD